MTFPELMSQHGVLCVILQGFMKINPGLLVFMRMLCDFSVFVVPKIAL